MSVSDPGIKVGKFLSVFLEFFLDSFYSSCINLLTRIATFPPTAEQLAGCLDSTASTPTETFIAGRDLPVKWKLSIPHANDPGVRIAIQFPGEPMTVLKDALDVNDESATVQLPAGKTSDKAILQWMWATKEDGGFYMACSDIIVKEEAGTLGGVATSGAPSVVPPAVPAGTESGTAPPVDPGNPVEPLAVPPVDAPAVPQVSPAPEQPPSAPAPPTQGQKTVVVMETVTVCAA